MVGLSVCHGFFNFVTLIPDEVRRIETWSAISLVVRFLTETTLLLPFTEREGGREGGREVERRENIRRQSIRRVEH